MKKIKKTLLRTLFTLGFLIVLLLGFLLNPVLLYSNTTKYKNCTIYHDEPISPNLYQLIDESFEKSRESEIFSEDIQIELCLNDGSYYPKLIEMVMGIDVIRAFSNKAVVHGQICGENDCMAWREREVKFTQWFCHALIHNLQFHKHGFWKSNPVGGHPDWKWEGYSEYISLGKNDDLTAFIEKSINSNVGEYDWVETSIGRGTTAQHIKFLAMTKYCFEIKNVNYSSFFEDSTSYKNTYQEMINWYKKH